MILIIKKIIGKWAYFNRKIALFQSPQHIDFENRVEYNYVVITNHAAAVLCCPWMQSTEYENRFLKQHLFCCLQNKLGNVVAYGWLNNSGVHYLGELNLEMILPKNTAVLYDFFTFELFRGRGLYAYLLQNCCRQNSATKIIYALPSNTSSCHGILKAHFKPIGVLTGFTKNKYLKMIKPNKCQN